MDNSSDVKQLLTEIRDLLRSNDERQKGVLRSIGRMMRVVYVLLAVLALFIGFLMWVIYMSVTTPQ